jgi:DNA-binding NtrC family response regulator
VHQRSGRGGAFVAVNCGALPENLIMSELFGSRRGAFSGAVDDRPGLVRAADGGTLFLDEVAELPLSAQASLLRVLQEGEVLAIGATRPLPVDVRVVAATHRDLVRMVAQRQFRDDLLARLSGFVVRLPSLRKRREDLGLLLAQLLGRACGERVPQLSNEAARALLLYGWPLNVRELDQTLRAAVVLAEERIELAHLPAPIRAVLRASVAAAAVEAPVRPARAPKIAQEELAELLRRHGGNISAVARELERDRVQVRRWIKHYGLDVSRFAE